MSHALPFELRALERGRKEGRTSVDHSTEVAFRHFQVHGGFLVSACQNVGGVSFSSRSRRDIAPTQPLARPACDSPLAPEARTCHRWSSIVRMGKCLIFSTVAGHRYVVQPG
jgi:hypothetical protein